MATNVGQRNVPDTPSNRTLNAVSKAMELALHTVKICSNENIFIPRYKDVTDLIVETATNIYVYANDANNTPVKKDSDDYEKNVKERLELERKSRASCSRLLGLINISHRLFHLRGRKVSYWTKLTTEARTYINKWYESECKRFK